jgi:hypothetical protein
MIHKEQQQEWNRIVTFTDGRQETFSGIREIPSWSLAAELAACEKSPTLKDLQLAIITQEDSVEFWLVKYFYVLQGYLQRCNEFPGQILLLPVTKYKVIAF